MIGQTIGNYKIIETLGEGGVGMVYKGVDTMLDREVAIKVLRPELASQISIVERFRSEAVTLAKLNHPNIATLYSLLRQGRDLFMVLEFLRGETLDRMLYRRGSISTEEAIPIFCQALDGINHAHELGIVHRDIKPGNMILTDAGVLKVLDFGIARLLGSSRKTRGGNVIGTLEYMSPEQVRGLETDARSDIYGLGIMLYEVLTGRLPFESENDYDLMRMQTEDPPRPPRQLNSDIPEAIETAILRAVAKDPIERFQTAGEFLETLIDAGFAFPNSVFGMTSMFGRISARPSNPGIKPTRSKSISDDFAIPMPETLPEVNAAAIVKVIPPTAEIIETHFTADDAPETGEQIKETRLGEFDSAPASREIKETRLSEAETPSVFEVIETQLGNESAADRVIERRFDVAETAEAVFETGETSLSFFDRLTWIHYAGAGAAVVIFFSLVGLAAVIPFMFGTGGKAISTEKPPQNVKKAEEQPKQKAEPTVKPKEETVTVEEPPFREEERPMPTPIPIQQPSDPTFSQPPGEKPSAPKPQAPKETVRKNPDPPVRKPSPPRRVEVPPDSRKQRLRDKLTGN